MSETEFMHTLLSAIAVGSGLFFVGIAVLLAFFRALEKEKIHRRTSYETFAKLAALIAVILIAVGVLVRLSL